jgi:CIC family chloride channel protein
VPNRGRSRCRLKGKYDNGAGTKLTGARHSAALWLAVIVTGLGAGLSTAALMDLLYFVQHTLWPGAGLDLLDAAARTDWRRHFAVLLGAGLLTAAGQLLLGRLPSGNSTDVVTAISLHAGRLPALRTLGSAVLSVVVVGLGASLGREGAPKQAGAVIANAASDRARLSDDERRLLVACGAGAGLAAAYGVPLGGALFALEVLRGQLALRFVLPALVTSLTATGVAWVFLPDAPTYAIPAYPGSLSVAAWALIAGPIAGLASVLFVRAVAWTDHHRPQGWQRVAAPVIVLGLLGSVSIVFPQLLGNGRDVSALAFTGQVAPLLLIVLLPLKPVATLLCLGSGVPGGLFTPSLALGALLGGVLGYPWSLLWPGVPPGLFAVLGAAAVLAATTQGPLSTVVLLIELTGQARSFILPLLLIVAVATLVARSLEARSIYDARLSDAEVEERRQRRGSKSPGLRT